MSSVTILFLLPHWSVLRAVFELLWISVVALHELELWLYLSVVEKKPSLLLLLVTFGYSLLSLSLFEVLKWFWTSNWVGRGSVFCHCLIFWRLGVYHRCSRVAAVVFWWIFCFFGFFFLGTSTFVCKMCLWLEMLGNLFWTAPGPDSDVSCFRELICKWHCLPHNLHLVSFILKIITACVRFQGLILCLFSSKGNQQVFKKVDSCNSL